MRTLSFNTEAKKHIANLGKLRSAADCELIDSYDIDCKGADTFVIIPCHVKEQGLYESLLAYKDAGISKYCSLIIYLNAGARTSKKDYSSLLKKRLKEIERAKAELPSLKMQVFSHHFTDNAIISRIRGIITDALIKCCFEQKIKDPILVSNDADALHYSKGYFKHIRDAIRKSEIDFLSGTIFWTGCDHAGRVRYKPAVPLPELYLNDLYGQSGDEVYRDYGGVYTTGCNSAFRLSAVAAIGGYDYEFAPFFDVEIGTKLKEFRQDEIDAKRFGNNGSEKAQDKMVNAAYMDECALSTNPRRAMLAFLNAVPYGEQFQNVGTVLGADLDISEYIDSYRSNENYIQAEDLLAYHKSAKAKEKVHTRIRASYLHFLQGEPTRNKVMFTKMLCPRAGLVISKVDTFDPDSESNEELDDPPTPEQLARIKNRLLISNIDFDWEQSTLISKLVNWIKLNR